MASSIIAANLQYISAQHYQSRKEPNSHPWHLILGLMAFSSVFNLSRVNRGKFSWSLILFHAWTGVMYPSKSSLSAISKSLWKTSAETCHRESLSRVGGASCSSVPCIDTAWPVGCALEICDRHGRSSLQAREHNVGNMGGRWVYLRQDKIDSCLEPFLLGKLVQVFIYVIFESFSPIVLPVLVAIVSRLTCNKPKGRGVWYRWRPFLTHPWWVMNCASHACIILMRVSAVGIILAVGTLDSKNHCPQTRLLWPGRTSGLTVPVEGCLLRNNVPGGPDEPFGAHPVQGCHEKIILPANVPFQQLNKTDISLVMLPVEILCR